MRVSEDTIQRGWNELVKAGWLKIHPLPQERRRSQGALKELRWARNSGAQSTRVLSASNPGAQGGSTIPGNQESLPGSPGETSQSGELMEKCSGCGGLLGYLIADGESADGALCLKCWNAR